MNPLDLFTTERTRVSHARSFRLPGYLIVEPLRPCRSLDTMGASVRDDLMRCLAKAEALVREQTGAERVYVLRFGEENENVHFHVVPRTGRVLEAYREACQDEPPFSGARIVDWIWFHHQDLGYGDADVAWWIESARAALASDRSTPPAWFAMAAGATAYCQWIEALVPLEEGSAAPETIRAAELRCASEARAHVLALLAAASDLGEVAPSSTEQDESGPYDVAQEAWEEAHAKTAAVRLGCYWQVSPGTEADEDADPVLGDASDDLADIWRDLKRGVLAWEARDYREAAWQWSFTFRSHWGTHAVDVLAQLLWWLSRAEGPESTE